MRQNIPPRGTLTNSLPIMEKPFIAFILAIIAGTLNGYTYHVAKIFSTVQSGNIILLGETIATKNWHHLYTIMITVLAFGLGSMITMLVELIFAKRDPKGSWSFFILCLEAVIIALLATGIWQETLTIEWICIIISFIGGMQGNGFHKIKGMLYGNVAVTLVVQLAFSYLMQFIGGKKGTLKIAALFFLVLLGFGFGGYVGTHLTILFQERSLFLPAALLLILAFYTLLMRKERGEVVDPT